MVHHSYDYVLVLMSYVVSVLGSFTALRLMAGIQDIHDTTRRWKRLILASLVVGVGAIWAMHFIGMLALNMPVKVDYAPGLTALSAVVAVIACLIGLSLTSRGDHSRLNLLTAGTYMGIGVAAMHYMGMAAMRMPATTVYNGAITSLSILIAIVASVAALWMAYKRSSVLQSMFGALVMGLAVCGMHYVGMAAARFAVLGTPEVAEAHGIDSLYLGMLVFGVIVVMLLGVLIAGLRNREVFAIDS
ncbi:MHYT domain-containing protein [Oleiagrimonas soli]|nr:MHYT domain-containing protein [Oleiagrimonas soli]MBB6184919.1 NO-binding membrane sensor protein with MHYT domain [Oleiagrimonas soli]